jgi:Flp pilus assembly protein CpaB
MTAAPSLSGRAPSPRGPALPPPRSRLRHGLAGVRRALLTWRRPLAALLAAGAVLAGIRAASTPPEPTGDVVVAAADLPGGRPLTHQDLTVEQVPVDSVPDGAATEPDPLVGRTLASPVRRGEPVTDVRVVADGLLDGYPLRVAAPVRVADAGVARLLRVGDRVDVVATDPADGSAEVVTRLAPVVALPREPRPGAASGPSGLAGGALVVLAVPPTTAVELAGAAASDLLSVILTE